MVSVLSFSIVVRGFEPWSGQTKDYKNDFCCFPAKHAVLRNKEMTGWLGIRIIYPSRVTCLPTDCCFNELSL